MRRMTLLLASMIIGLVLAGGVALAANVISCPGGLCEGTTGDDEMTGTSNTDYIYAREGNDTLRGLGKFDDLRGGPGNDTLDGGGGNDQYNVYDNDWGADRISADSSGAKDWLIFQISPGALTIDLRPSSARAEVTSGANTINFASRIVIEWVQAGPEGDTVRGNEVNNYLSGAGGNDTLAGRRVTTGCSGTSSCSATTGTTPLTEARAKTSSTGVRATTPSIAVCNGIDPLPFAGLWASLFAALAIRFSGPKRDVARGGSTALTTALCARRRGG